MTEQEWLESDDPQSMLAFLRGMVCERKLRLFAVACCRRHWKRFPRPLRECVEVAERHADGVAEPGSMSAAWGAYLAFRDYRFVNQRAAVGHLLWGVSPDRQGPEMAAGVMAKFLSNLGGSGESAVQAELLRDVVGNPFRPPSESLTPTVPAWVLGAIRWAYDSRAFLGLPVWADAIEEAGCENADILAHLRQPGAVHVRGCWALDLILGRE